jgi:lipopolysaccharide export LptBFGC system permease protein LptF
MLVWYYLKRFYLTFLGIFFVLLFVLGFSDLIVRLTVIPSLSFIPKIIYLMLPFMAVIAMPLASSLAVQTVLGRGFEASEMILIYYLSKAQGALRKAVLIFSCTMTLLYIPVVMHFAPTNHYQGKQMLVKLAQDHLTKLEAGKFHYLLSKATFYFKRKEITPQGTIFYDMFLSIKSPKGDGILTAKEGHLGPDGLHIKDGVMHNKGQEKQYCASFCSSHINLEELLNPQKTDDQKTKELFKKEPKDLSFSELTSILDKRLDAFVEFHVRIARIVWQFFFPFLALWGIIVWSKIGENGLLFSVFLTCVFFLFSYITVGLSKIASFNRMLVPVAIYGALLCLVVPLYVSYRKKL